jgi:hypothetical protein
VGMGGARGGAAAELMLKVKKIRMMNGEEEQESSDLETPPRALRPDVVC